MKLIVLKHRVLRTEKDIKTQIIHCLYYNGERVDDARDVLFVIKFKVIANTFREFQFKKDKNFLGQKHKQTVDL